MTKEQLETNLAALKLLQNETNDKLNDHKVQISLLEKQLEDINKPEITPMMIDNIHNVVENVLNDFGWDDSDNYQDLEYEIDYDGRVSLSSISFDTYDIQEKIVEKVCSLFKEADCPEDGPTAEQLDTTEPDNHKPV